jgi:hypothetical protein
MIDMLTMPYNPRTFYYFLLGAGQRVDLVREGAMRSFRCFGPTGTHSLTRAGYAITKEHRFHVRPSRHFTRQEVVQQLRDMGLDGGQLKLHFNPPYVECN